MVYHTYFGLTDEDQVLAVQFGARPGHQRLLANLFLHYVFDAWMERNYPTIPFVRYADDVVCHSKTERQARHLMEVLKKRFAECGLELHPEKTKIVYCKDDGRRGDYPN